MWRLLEEGLPLERVHAALCAEYEVDAETLRRDLDELIRHLAKEGLVEVGAGGSAAGPEGGAP